MSQNIPKRNVLFIALVIYKPYGLGINDMQESLTASPVLTIRKAIIANTGQIEAITLLNKINFSLL